MLPLPSDPSYPFTPELDALFRELATLNYWRNQMAYTWWQGRYAEMLRLYGAQSPEAAERLSFFEMVMKAELHREAAERDFRRFLSEAKPSGRTFMLDTDALHTLVALAEQHPDRRPTTRDRFLVTPIQAREIFNAAHDRRERLQALVSVLETVGSHTLSRYAAYPAVQPDHDDRGQAWSRSDNRISAIIAVTTQASAVVVTDDPPLRARAKTTGLKVWSPSELSAYLIA